MLGVEIPVKVPGVHQYNVTPLDGLTGFSNSLLKLLGAYPLPGCYVSEVNTDGTAPKVSEGHVVDGGTAGLVFPDGIRVGAAMLADQ